jgi:soluble lytic murein transglycosylase-like protein
MKLYELTLTEEQQLEEARLRHALAAAGLAGAAALSGLNDYRSTQPTPAPTVQAAPQADVTKVEPVQQPRNDVFTLTQTILDNYRIDPLLAKKIAITAKKYESDVFPTAADILAIVGIESSFNPHSVSGLRRDPAKGLMQIRPGVHNLPVNALSTIDKQIKAGSNILHHYYGRFKSAEGAVQAYNVGETSFANLKHKKLNPVVAIRVNAAASRYLTKFSEERKMYNQL